MSFMLLIIEPPQQRAQRSEAEGRELYARMQAFAAELAAAGKLKAAESLAADSSAVRISRASGTLQCIDGPFAEAKEMVGGFFLLDQCSRDEALNLAARCPAAEWCTVEVRPLAPCFNESRG